VSHRTGPSGSAELAELLADVASGHPPPADGRLEIVAPSRPGEAAVLGFCAHHVVVAEGVEVETVRMLPGADDLSDRFSPPFLAGLCALLGGRRVSAIDAVMVAAPRAASGGLPDGLVEVTAREHPRVARALRYRRDVRAWACPGGESAALVLLGRGLGGRLETAFEVAPEARGRGLGRRLAAAAVDLAAVLAPNEPVWAQVAPANVPSMRVLLDAGYRPVGAEALLIPAVAARRS
jgi:GNAT superfamily N-acetyltransferase